MSGAGALGHLALRFELIDADDLPCAADARTLDDRQTNPAAAEDRNRLPRFEPRGAQRRPDPGQDAAADQGSAVERQFGVDLYERIFVQQHLLGVARNADELPQRLALLREPRGRPLRPGHEAAGAQIRMSGKALRAVAAKPRETGDNVVAGFDGSHLRADRLDDPGTLVPEHDRPVEREPAEPVDDV